jgi:hypothetical protein
MAGGPLSQISETARAWSVPVPDLEPHARASRRRDDRPAIGDSIDEEQAPTAGLVPSEACGFPGEAGALVTDRDPDPARALQQLANGRPPAAASTHGVGDQLGQQQ